MNKQEALEAVLREARRYEEPHREVRSWREDQIQDAVLEAARELDHLITRLHAGDVTARTTAQYRERLRRLAGAALELMITEVTVVEGQDWLATKEPPSHSLPSSYQPIAVNGLTVIEPARVDGEG